MTKLDWTSFKKRISINARKEDILNSWKTQDALETWFLSQAQFYTGQGTKRDRSAAIGPNDTYQWMWHGSDRTAEGRVISNNNKDNIQFTFLGCDVEVKILEEAGEHIVEVSQTNIASDEDTKMNTYVECSRGWTFYLANLKSILEGGIDLRNKNSNLRNVINT